MDFFNFWNIVKALFTILGMFAVLYGINAYIDKKINRRINEPEYIKKVAKHIRPSIIFDLDGVILFDLGGMEYIEGLEVKKSNQEKIIIITPKKYMPSSPILTCIDPVGFKSDLRRGPGLKWEYIVGNLVFSGGNRLARFRLEIVTEYINL